MTLSRRSFLKLSGATAAALCGSAAGARAAGDSVRGLYFPTERLVDPEAVAAFQDLVLHAGANTVVLDIKNEGGIVHVPFDHPLKPGRKPRYAYPDALAVFFEWCQGAGVRPVARQVVFQDPWFAAAHPALALLDESGNLWRGIDGQGRAFADPFSDAVHDYNAAIAEAAARMGFPEVQLDYVRFPTGRLKGLAPRQDWTFENRTGAIGRFLAAAAPRVRAAGGRVSADVFGITAWPELTDSGIGQYLETMAPHLDALCPMAYPSTYGSGIPNCPDRCLPSTAHPWEILYHTTRLARERAKAVAPDVQVMPWIQTFADYRFRRPFGVPEYWSQQRGALHAGATGIYCWGPTGDYPVDVFLPPTSPLAPETRFGSRRYR